MKFLTLKNRFHLNIPASAVSSARIVLESSVTHLVFALAYSLALCQIPDTSFMDFQNYLNYVEHSSLWLSLNLCNGLLVVFSNEPVWLLLNSVLAQVFDPQIVVRIIIFFSAFSVAWLILRHHPKHFVWLILFLFLPQIITNYLNNLRQGAAIAIFLWGWYSVSRPWRWLLLGIAPLVHASFFFILVLLWLTWALKAIRFDPLLRAMAFVAVGIIAGFGTGWLAQAVGARQAGVYDFQRPDVSGLGFLLWSIILVVFFTAKRIYLRKYAFETGVILFYLSTYWLFGITARIFESGLVLVLIAGLMLPGWRKQVFLAVVLGSGMLQWILRLGQPALGFGIG